MLLDRYSITDDTIYAIGKFSILWGRFEQVYFDTNVDSGKLLRLASEILPDLQVFELYLAVKATATEYLGEVDGEVIATRIYSESHPGKDEEREHILNFLTGDPSQVDWIGCMLFIQRIRNNMFHGLKDIYSLNDQKEMFISICNLLDAVLKNDRL